MKKYNLEQKITKKMLSHAIILAGKQDLSDISLKIAKSFTCQEENPPCNQCNFCKKADKGINPDIIILDFKDEKITVDEIRKLRKDAYILPNECEKKVYIIKKGQNMNVQAQNALLKTLEEPPRFVCFIIECENEQKLMDTILSRCSIYRLNDETDVFDDEIFEKAKKMVISIAKNDELALLETKIKTKAELLSILTIVKIFLRDSLILNEENSATFDTCKKLSLAKSTAELYRIYDISVKIEGLCEFNISVQNLIYYFATELYRK
ncbi:MAG: hypothetical protein R3Y09_03470 [Clostridia bacterium]